MKKLNISILVFFLALQLFSQNQKDREFIIRHTNVEKLIRISEEFLQIQNQFKKRKVEQILNRNDGNKNYFSHFDKSGSPVYYSLENESSAKSSKIDLIRTDGNSGLNLDGSGLEFGLWDVGPPRFTHQEFNNNITVIDNAAMSSHATHIAGILIASGVVPGAKGMAPSATIKSYTSSNWISEVPVYLPLEV